MSVKWIRRGGLVRHDIAETGETVLYDPGADAIHALSPAALRIWDAMPSPLTEEALVGAIGGTPEESAPIVAHALSALAERDLIFAREGNGEETPAVVGVEAAELTRRDFFKAAWKVPFVVTFLATAASAQGSTCQPDTCNPTICNPNCTPNCLPNNPCNPNQPCNPDQPCKPGN